MGFSEWLGIISIGLTIVGIIVSVVGVHNIIETKNIIKPKEVNQSGLQQGNHNTMNNNYGMNAEDVMAVTEKTVDHKIKTEHLASISYDTTYEPLED